MDIRPFAPGDEVAISEIYNPYITGTTVTFEEEALTAQAMRERIDSYRQHFPWLVCVIDGRVVGYGYASRFHPRAAYRHTAEVSVYVRQGCMRPCLPNCARSSAMCCWRRLPCPMRPAWACMNRWASPRWRTSARWGASSASGSMWAIGS
jgi:hypothetical protein